MKKAVQNDRESYLKQCISEAEQRVILDTLREYGWVKKKVADALHTSRITLDRKLKKYGISNLRKEVDMVYLESKKIIPLEEAEKRILAHALKLSKGNIRKAAKELHIGRATLYRKIDRYGLVKREFNKYRVSK